MSQESESERRDLIVEPDKKVGRPKGSKNKITMLKLMTEEVVRSKNLDRMLQVCDEIITEALAGDRDCRKLVWTSIMSKSGTDQNQTTGAMPEIIIRSDHPPVIRQVIDATIVEDTSNGRQQADE